MTAAGNPEAAYEAGKNGYPAPEIVSPHNYTDEEEEAWEAGREEFEALHDEE